VLFELPELPFLDCDAAARAALVV